MKRKVGAGYDPDDDARPAIYTSPNLECTMLLDTGGSLNTTDTIGKISTIPINASMSSGAKMFQYNRFFWNNDLFSFNYANCAIFVAIAYYEGPASQKTSFVFYPIYLPRGVMTALQSISCSQEVTTSPAKRKQLIDDVLYYLNGAFTSFNFDVGAPITTPAPGIQWPPGGPLSTGPSLYTSYLKGYLPRPTANNSHFPIFQDAKEPPLKFIYVSSNNQIALVKNPEFWKTLSNYPPAASIAFQLVSPESYFASGTNNPNSLIANHNGGAPAPAPPPLVDVFVPSVFSNVSASSDKGWCAQGPYGLGFSMGRNSSNPNLFSDVYESYDERLALFNQTNWPGDSNLNFTSSGAFLDWAKANKLSTDFVLAPRICSLLPSRFITCKSEALTRTQKAMVLSNNPSIGSNTTLCLTYLDLDNLKTKIDFTTRKGTARLADPVMHLNPSFSILSLDMVLQDEWGNYVQNFRSPSGFNPNFDPSPISPAVYGTGSGNFLSLLEGEVAFGNNIYTIPAWLAALNPNTASGNTEPLISPFSTYLSQSFYGLFKRNVPYAPPPNGKKMVIPPEFTPSMPYSGNIIHFGRVMGT